MIISSTDFEFGGAVSSSRRTGGWRGINAAGRPFRRTQSLDFRRRRRVLTVPSTQHSAFHPRHRSSIPSLSTLLLHILSISMFSIRAPLFAIAVAATLQVESVDRETVARRSPRLRSASSSSTQPFGIRPKRKEPPPSISEEEPGTKKAKTD